MATQQKDKYTEGIGRRKTAVARVRITPSKKHVFTVNGKSSDDYFPSKELQHKATEALMGTDFPDKFSVSVKVSGGGISAQAEAVRHGIGRALVKFNEDFRGKVKELGYLKRDSRMKERKKPGLKKARKAPQWSKR